MTNKDNDLNIRAAKALGWEYENHKDCGEVFIVSDEHSLWFIENVRISFGGFRVPFGNLMFPTSYDWAMLGLDEINNCRDDKIFSNKLRCVVGNLEQDPVVEDIYYSFQATPAQITEAWVQVLEANNGQ